MVRFDRVSSTQDVARKYAEDGREVVVVAEEQTRGRGRLGRKWFSPRGGLWFSVVLRHIETPVTLVCLAAGLAVAKTVEELTGLKPCLKWPNDVLVNGRKVCGVLVEGKFTGEKPSYLIVGVGLNVNIPLDSFPPSIRGKATSLLSELGTKVDKELLLTRILTNLKRFTAELEGNQGGKIVEEWKKRTCTLGKLVKIVVGGSEIKGLAVDVDSDGCLLVETDSKLYRVCYGEVTHLEFV